MIRHTLRHQFPFLVALLTACIAAISCGKKGPPLAPFSRSPAVPSEVSVRRLGHRVEVRFTVPAANVDGRRPATIDRVEVWALTGPALGADLFLDHATLVGSVPVRRPPPPPPDVEEGKPPPPPPPPSTEPGLDQGQPGLIVDELAADELTPVTIAELEEQRVKDEEQQRKLRERLGPPRLLPPDIGPPMAAPPMRYYVVLGRNGGRWGAGTQRIPVPITDPPPAPDAPEVEVGENFVGITWEAPAGVRQPVHAGTAPPSAPAAAATRAPGATTRSTPAAPAPAPATAPLLPPGDEVRPAPRPSTPAPPDAAPDDGQDAPPAVAVSDESPDGVSQAVATSPAGTDAAGTPAATPLLNSRSLSGFPSVVIGYNVYEVAPPNLTPAPLQPGEVPLLPRRLTPQPTRELAFRDAQVEFGTERCFAVRTVEITGSIAVESTASPTVCVSPADTFPPKAPASLAAVASEGAISLIWEAATEPDLAGYIVLRGEAPGTTLEPLMSAPVKETTYRDTTVTPGVRYVYAVVAVDTATPQNVSAQSNPVEETAR